MESARFARRTKPQLDEVTALLEGGKPAEALKLARQIDYPAHDLFESPRFWALYAAVLIANNLAVESSHAMQESQNLGEATYDERKRFLRFHIIYLLRYDDRKSLKKAQVNIDQLKTYADTDQTWLMMAEGLMHMQQAATAKTRSTRTELLARAIERFEQVEEVWRADCPVEQWRRDNYWHWLRAERLLSNLCQLGDVARLNMLWRAVIDNDPNPLRIKGAHYIYRFRHYGLRWTRSRGL